MYFRWSNIATDDCGASQMGGEGGGGVLGSFANFFCRQCIRASLCRTDVFANIFEKSRDTTPRSTQPFLFSRRPVAYYRKKTGVLKNEGERVVWLKHTVLPHLTFADVRHATFDLRRLCLRLICFSCKLTRRRLRNWFCCVF